MKRTSCIIPAYNEAGRIGAVLELVTSSDLFKEIIVVNDGSKDKTAEVAAGFPKAKLINQTNQGKSRAIAEGLRHATSEFVLLLDADLLGLTRDDLVSLIAPVEENVADISISLRGNSPKFWRLIGLDFISGERVMPLKLLANNIDTISKLSGFALEVYINTLIIGNNLRIKVVKWPKVRSPYKVSKIGLWGGVKGDSVMMYQIFRNSSLWAQIKQIYHLRKLRV